MPQVLYVPLDERACNYRFPQKLAQMTHDMTLLVPPVESMGCLKTPADRERLWSWLAENAPQCEYAVLSVDTLVYGNIIASRTHHLTCGDCAALLQRFRALKERCPQLHIHAFNLAARVAAYNDAHEDPDYWATQGWNLWRLTYLEDKIASGCADDGEKAEHAALQSAIPADILADFRARRKVDRFTNLACVDLVREGVFDVLTIPKDDTAEYGCAAMDQRAIAEKVRAERLMDRVLVYPGADEVGSVLFARVFCLAHAYTPRVYVRYSSTLGPTVVPKYEDRPLHEGVKAQITSAGGVVEDNTDHADCMLALNAPGRHMIEAADQDKKDLTFSSCLNMNEFLRYCSYFAREYGKPIGLAEVSVCNGCEREFMEDALLTGVLDKVQCAGGWNTAQNTIGVVLAQLILAAYYRGFADAPRQRQISEEFKLRSIVCDWFFQSDALPAFLAASRGKIDPYFLREHKEETKAFIAARLQQCIAEKLGGVYHGQTIVLRGLDFNWDGVFYIDLDVGLQSAAPQ